MHCPKAQAELLEAALASAGALAVTLSDAGDDPQLEPPPGATPLWQAVRVTALLADDPDSRALADSIIESLGPMSLIPPTLETLADRPWERAWLDDFKPTRFGRRLWVCPQGQPAPDAGAVVVDLDPGLAFGTGSHPTTALCLEWLDSASLAGRSLLDYGCGSGILAIAALKLGAERVLALDHDPQAVEATRENAERNGVAERLTAGLPGELGRTGPRPPFGIIVANILSGPLVELAPRLLAALSPGGDLVLSGILSGQQAPILEAYREQVSFETPRVQEDWLLIHGTGHSTGPGAPARRTSCR